MFEANIQKQLKDKEEAEEESAKSKGRSVMEKKMLQCTEEGKAEPMEYLSKTGTHAVYV